MSKAEQIRGLTQNLHIQTPTTSDSSLMWFLPDQSSRTYFRLVPLSDDVPQEMYMDVWVEANFSIDRAGFYTLHMEAVLYNGMLEMKEDTTEIAHLTFTDTDISVQQTVLNNWEVAYMKRAKEAVKNYTEWAEAELVGEMEERNIA
jgi:hypothetical protein